MRNSVSGARLRRAIISARHCLVVAGGVCLSACDQPAAPTVAEKVTIAFAGHNGSDWDIYTIREDGTGLTNLTTSPEDDLRPSWSPDHRSIAFFSRRQPTGVWIMNADGSGRRPLAATQHHAVISWSPDGTRLVFGVLDDSGSRLLVMRPDGTERRTLLPGSVGSPSWSSDGRTILYSKPIDNSWTHIFAIPVEGGTPRDLTEFGITSFFYGSDPAMSADGYTIAFIRADLDRGLWVMRADGRNPNQITLGEDRHPRWLRANQLLVQRASGPLWSLYLISADGTTETELVTGLANSLHPSR